MDERLSTDTTRQRQAADTPLVEETSAEYLGRWNRLVSTTNWEKGRIICQWRDALIEAEAPPASYTDDAWSRRVGNVTAQHVGRLRRVFQRFGATHQEYPGLYWSHFQVAMDWSDAEMWLEGAVQNGWSIAQMGHKRWEAIGAPPQMKPREEDILTAELDEDSHPAGQQAIPETISDSLGVVRDAATDPSEVPGVPLREPGATGDQPTLEPFRPFDDVLPPLPRDLYKAFHAFRRAILRHKRSGWREVSLDEVLLVLELLRQLASRPTEGDV